MFSFEPIDCADCVNENNEPSACCYDVQISIGEAVDFQFWGDARWMVAHKNVSVCKRLDENEWVVIFKTPCEKLTSDGRCEIYETRPKLCEEYSRHTCIMNSPQMAEFELEFDTVEEMDQYIKDCVLEELQKDAEHKLISARESLRELKDKVKEAGLKIIQTERLIKTLAKWPFK